LATERGNPNSVSRQRFAKKHQKKKQLESVQQKQNLESGIFLESVQQKQKQIIQ
jgi:hypothetical protein